MPNIIRYKDIVFNFYASMLGMILFRYITQIIYFFEEAEYVRVCKIILCILILTYGNSLSTITKGIWLNKHF